MFIAGRYSFRGGEEFIQQQYPHLLGEVETVIASIDAEACRTKESKEITMPGKLLYSPKALNKAFKTAFPSIWMGAEKRVLRLLNRVLYSPLSPPHYQTERAETF